jgi:RNA polymerase sigma factor (sigma-70 family)|tara:strand:- start:1610 stop:2131 length:522 start_codon:yes stop_codon:yes gene_type:complete
MVEKYINKHYKEILNKVKGVTRNHHLTDDLLQDCILNFLEKGNDYTTQVLNDGKIQHYIVRMAHIQFNSSTSPFYTRYRKASRKTQDIDNYDVVETVSELKEDTAKLADDVKLYISKLPIYERTITEKHLYDGVSQREMSRYYNINRIHISRDINRVQSNIKLTFNRKDYESE